jgi:hypothetical protein
MRAAPCARLGADGVTRTVKRAPCSPSSGARTAKCCGFAKPKNSMRRQSVGPRQWRGHRAIRFALDCYQDWHMLAQPRPRCQTSKCRKSRNGKVLGTRRERGSRGLVERAAGGDPRRGRGLGGGGEADRGRRGGGDRRACSRCGPWSNEARSPGWRCRRTSTARPWRPGRWRGPHVCSGRRRQLPR